MPTRAKQLKDLGPPEDVEYIERERHAVAVHEACHAVVAFRTRQHMEIDLATIEKGSDYLGMVASIPPEDQFTRWRSEYEADILVSLASLAGERMFFEGDSSSGVSGDLESATAVASFMEGYWGMGSTVSSYSTARRLEVGSPAGDRRGRRGEPERCCGRLADRSGPARRSARPAETSCGEPHGRPRHRARPETHRRFQGGHRGGAETAPRDVGGRAGVRKSEFVRSWRVHAAPPARARAPGYARAPAVGRREAVERRQRSHGHDPR